MPQIIANSRMRAAKPAASAVAIEQPERRFVSVFRSSLKYRGYEEGMPTPGNKKGASRLVNVAELP